MKGSIKKDIFNIPNLFTIFRIILIPVVAALITYESPRNGYLAALFFSIASGTDFIDGYLARRLNLITVTGKFLDPLADKLMVVTCLVMLIPLDRVPAWLVVILLAREFSITVLRALASQEGLVLSAGQEGKAKAALQMVGIVGLLVHYPYEINFIIFKGIIDFHRVGLILVILSMVFSLLSAFSYFKWFVVEIDKKSQS
ncbi:MAG: CDP-diacylglycerol--glycerol-3-phosphate 3-phosphatidyltransferase [Myxococcota bacterium]